MTFFNDLFSSFQAMPGTSISSGTSTKSLPDIEPENQGGGFDTSYDDAYLMASQASGVPFALIKAHSIRESRQDPKAYHYDNKKSGASYGLLQTEWLKGVNRLAPYGYTDDDIGDGSILYNPTVSASIGAKIMAGNISRFSLLRDAINAYNTGVAESVRVAPNNYVNDVLRYYSTLINGSDG